MATGVTRSGRVAARRRKPGRGEPASLNDVAARLVSDEPALITSLDFGPLVAPGSGQGASLIIGDQSDIPLLAVRADSRLDHRMALLARSGDIVMVRHREPEFEAYLSDVLGITGVTFAACSPDAPISLTKQMLASPEMIGDLAKHAKRHDGLTLNAYLTTGHTWRLAQVIGAASRRLVHVCGPSPRTVRRANDKLWFSDLARRVVGNDAIPATLSAFGPAAAAGLLAHLSKHTDQVVIKVPDSAGSAGNLVLQSRFVRAQSLTRLRQFLLRRLHSLGWQDSYPILIGVWDKDVSCSPSVQLWIPLVADGPPEAEGVFEQRVHGDEGEFVGAARSTLPDTLKRQLIAEAATIAQVLQQIGYFGRCSFDAVIRDPPGSAPLIHWIECNGRWGGVSIPMQAARNVTGRVLPEGMVIVQETLPERTLHTPKILRLLDDLLLRPGQGAEGLILMSPPEAVQGSLVNFVALADKRDGAAHLAKIAMLRLSEADHGTLASI